jgi:hypothetical protein
VKSELPEWLRSLDLVPMNINWEELEANEKSWMRRWDEEVKGKGKSASAGL